MHSIVFLKKFRFSKIPIKYQTLNGTHPHCPNQFRQPGTSDYSDARLAIANDDL